MPTGYTACVCDGKVTDFKEFAIQCAHAFGALVLLRDEGMNAPIPEFKPSSYASEALEKAKTELSRVKAMTPDECDAAAVEDYRKALEAHQKHVAECKVIRERLQAMRSKVADWQPPTSDHNGLKDFMIEQIDSTINFDGKPGNYYLDQAARKSGPIWRAEKLQRLTKDIGYYTDENQKEIERTASRNKWVAELKKSLQD